MLSGNSKKILRSILMISILLLSVFSIGPGFSINNQFLNDTAGITGSRPDEVDLFGPHVWRNDSDVPKHEGLGFRVRTGAS